MNIFRRCRIWWRIWRRRWASKRHSSQLREFVYLDEISVYSLVASRLGPIAVEFSKTETISLQSDTSASIGSNSGVSAGVGSRISTNQANTSQVLRKSIVQTTFKELYELEFQSLAIKPLTDNPPTVKDLTDILSSAETLAIGGWVIDPEKLTRGRLFEAEVLLEADSIYKTSAVVSSILEILQGNSQLFGFDPNGDISQVKSINQILEKLIAGLVPVRGLAVDYSVIISNQKEWIIHRLLLEQLPDEEHNLKLPLYVVGVAEQSLFWKDIRRVLFSKAQYRVLSRISKSGLQSQWTPVKLVDVLDIIAPDLAKQIDTVGINALQAINGANVNTEISRLQDLMFEALVAYAHLLLTHYNLKISPEVNKQIADLSAQYSHLNGSILSKREAFNIIADYIISSFDLKREPEIIAGYRFVALMDVGIDITGNVNRILVSEEIAASLPDKVRYLDTDFVAIYW